MASEELASLRAQLAMAQGASLADAAARTAAEAARAAAEAARTDAESRFAAEAAARADAEARLVEEAAARAAADVARTDAEARLVEALRPLELGVAAGAAAPSGARLVRATFVFELETLMSPTIAKRSFLAGRFVELIDAPVSVAADVAAAAAFASLAKLCRGARGMMEESEC